MSVFVKFEDIIVDNSIQIRTTLNDDRVNEFIEIYDKLPPIKLVQTEDGRLYLADGRHRFEAGLRKGENGYQCEIEKGDLKRALEINIKSNCYGPLSLSRQEKRDIIDKALRFFPERANSWIAEMIGVSMQTVESRRLSLEKGGVLKEEKELKTRDGRSYPRKIPAVLSTKNKEEDDVLNLIYNKGLRQKPEMKKEEDIQIPSSTTKPKVRDSEQSGDHDALSLFVDENLLSYAISENGKNAVGIKKSDNNFEMVFYENHGDRFYKGERIVISKENLFAFFVKVME